MDNCMDSFDMEEEAIEFRHILQEGLGNVCFLWTQWISKSRVVLASILKDIRSDPAFDLNMDAFPAEQTLRITLNWCVVTIFSLNINN